MRNSLTGLEMIEKADNNLERNVLTGCMQKRTSKTAVKKSAGLWPSLTGEKSDDEEFEKNESPRWPSLVGEESVAKSDGEEFELFAPFIKADSDKQILYACVYEPGVEDSQGDEANAEEIEKAAHQFLSEVQTIKVMHKGKARKDVQILESYVAPSDCVIGEESITKGSWILVLKINSAKLWKKCKNGSYTGVSMGGQARVA